MPKLPVPATFNFLHARAHAVSRIIRLVATSAALVALGSAATLVALAPKLADAAGDATHPGIFRIPLDTPLTERAVYPPGIAVGSFDGAYTVATMYKSDVFAGNKVAFWEAKPAP
jgi:hypothetical protein